MKLLAFPENTANLLGKYRMRERTIECVWLLKKTAEMAAERRNEMM